MNITPSTIAVWVGMCCLLLVLLYMFYDYLGICVYFSRSSSISLFLLLSANQQTLPHTDSSHTTQSLSQARNYFLIYLKLESHLMADGVFQTELCEVLDQEPSVQERQSCTVGRQGPGG